MQTFLKKWWLWREFGHMMLRISRRPILVLTVTKWWTGKIFHNLKQVFGGFLTAFLGHSSTGRVKVNENRELNRGVNTMVSVHLVYRYSPRGYALKRWLYFN